MDDTSRTSPDSPTPESGAHTGTGWSTPKDSPQANVPWNEQRNDTGEIPRPNDTRQIPSATPGTGSPQGDAPTPQSAPPHGTPIVTPASAAIPPFARPQSAEVLDGSPYAATPGPTSERPSKRGTAMIAALALGAGLLGGAAGAGIYDAITDDPVTPVRSLDTDAAEATDAAHLSSVEEVAAQLTPTVVSISVQGDQGVGSGSGVVISSDGQILTNAHVADAAGEDGRILVTFSDGTQAEAEVVGSDQQSDVAVIQAQDVSGLATVEFGNSDALGVGEEVIAFGSPLGLDGTVTRGIVSALHRPVQAGDAARSGSATLFEAIQTDASINPGNSGGPLVNMAGQIVGINTAIASSPGTFGNSGSIGLGFAIPINTARHIAEQLIAGDDVAYARIGIGVSDGEQTDPEATVVEVVAGGAADAAGLAEGDVITHIDGRFLADASALVAAARSYEPGETVILTYVRDGDEGTVEIILGTSADDPPVEDDEE